MADFACKNIKVTIENEAGTFTGSVDTKTNLPSGYGVFETSEWIHCGKFSNGLFADGKRVSANKKTNELKLVKTKN